MPALQLLKSTPVSPVLPAAQTHRLTGTGHSRMTHATLSGVGDVTTKLLIEDLSTLSSASLRLVLDFWTLELHHAGSPTIQRRLRKKKIRTPSGSEEDTRSFAHFCLRGDKAVDESL